MKLSECKPVITDDNRLGVIAGLTNNYPYEDIRERMALKNAIPLVQWSSGESYGIHPRRIKEFKG